MLKATAGQGEAVATGRSRARPSEGDGVIEGWFTFETGGRARRRPSPPQGRQVLDAADHMTELKGHEEPQGPEARRWAPSTASTQIRKTWLERSSEEEARARLSRRSPMCLIIGGGQGGIALGARLRRLGVPTIIVEKNERPGDSWRKRYKSLCLHDPVWYDHLPYLPFPDELAGLLAEGQDRRLAGNVHQGHGAELLGLDRVQERRLRRSEAGMDGRRSCATASRSRCGPSSWCWPPACPASRTCRKFPGMETIQGRAASFEPASRPATPIAARKCVVIGSNNSAHDICAGAVGSRRRRHHGAALVDPCRQVRHADGARPRRRSIRSRRSQAASPPTRPT